MYVSLENAFRIVFRDAFSNKVLNNRFCQDYCHLTYMLAIWKKMWEKGNNGRIYRK